MLSTIAYKASNYYLTPIQCMRWLTGWSMRFTFSTKCFLKCF